MNEVFCHHPSVIHGRDRQCPDCGQEVGPNRLSLPLYNSTPSAWYAWIEIRRRDPGGPRCDGMGVR